MEICGSILTNSDYSEFRLTCIYCSSECEIFDWEQFVLHMRSAHLFDYVDEEKCGQSENEYEIASPQADNFEAYVEMDNSGMDIKEEYELWPHDYVDVEGTDDISKALESLLEVKADLSPTGNGMDTIIESTELDNYGDEIESQALSTNEDPLLDNSSDDSDDADQDFSSSSDSEEGLEVSPSKRSRNNPLSVKRTLKVSFIRHNPRVLHFIEEFKNHTCLWNPNDPKFSNAKSETEAYNSMIEGMDKKANVLFTLAELKKSIQQLLNQFTIASQKASDQQLTGVAARYLNKCKFLSSTPSQTNSDDDGELNTDVIQLNFKDLNDVTTSFIEAFENFPVLYDSSAPEFRSIDARTKAYIDIAQMLAPALRVNETEVHLAVMRLRKWTYMTLRRVKSKELRRACTKPELHYLQLCSYLPPKSESFVINCEYCDKRFFIDYSLRAHLVKVHKVGELPYLCSQCPRRFEKVHDMERHKLRQHCEKLLKCDHCNSRFSLKNDLLVHTRVHTGEKPYVCEKCGKSFRLKLLLDYHINGFHLNLRPFECEICHNTYRKRVQLKNHLKAHLNIKDKKCDECGAAFSCPTSLSRHRKTYHSKSRPKSKSNT